MRLLPPAALVPCSSVILAVGLAGERDFPMLLADANAFASKAKEVGRFVPVLVAGRLTHGAVPTVLTGDKQELGPRVLAFLRDPPAFLAAANKDGGK